MVKSLKQFFIILILLVIVIFSILFYCSPKKISNIPTKEDSLKLEIESIKKIQDTILIDIYKRDTVIKYVKEQYCKDSVIISNQSVYEDIEFFSKYLSSYIK